MITPHSLLSDLLIDTTLESSIPSTVDHSSDKTVTMLVRWSCSLSLEESTLTETQESPTVNLLSSSDHLFQAQDQLLMFLHQDPSLLEEPV